MKKILAIILATAMLISLVPAAFAADWTDYDETLCSKFLFTSKAHTANADKDSVTFAKNSHLMEDTIKGVSSPWEYLNRYTGSGYGTRTDCTSWHIYTNGEPLSFNGGDSTADSNKSAIGFEIEVEKAGTYYPRFTFFTEKCSPKVELYLIEKPEDEENWHVETAGMDKFYAQLGRLSVNDRIGVVDLYGDAVEEKTVKLSAEITVKKDNSRYYFIIVPNGKNPKMTEILNTDRNETYTRMKFISLELTEDVKVERPTLTYDMTINAFTEMPWSYDSKNTVVGTLVANSEWQGWGSFPGIRNVGKAGQTVSGQMANTSFMNWEATTNYGTTLDDKLEAPKKVMDLTKTDPWAFVALKTAGSFYIDTTEGKEGIFENWQYSEGTYTSTQSGTYVIFKVIVPYAGKYMLSAKGPKFNYGGISGIHFLSEEKAKSYPGTYTMLSKEKLVGWFSSAPVSALTTIKDVPGISDITINDVGADGYSVIGEVDVPEAGVYYVCFDPKKESYYKNTNYITSSNKIFQYFYLSGMKLTPIDEDKKEINERKAEYQRVSSVTAPDGMSTDSVTVSAVNVTAVAADIHGNAVEAAVKAEVSGKTISAFAPSVDGYDFLYWTKDIGLNKKTISTIAEFDFVGTAGNNILTAVYRAKTDEDTTAIFYDGNGDEVGRALVADGKVTMPELPGRTGWKASAGWKLYGGDGTVYAAGTDVDVDGAKALFVANYEELEDITVTIDGAHTVKLNGEAVNSNLSCLYGDEITVKAYKRENGTGERTFNFWKKNGEIVSFDTEYTFKASDDCELVAVYESFEPINKLLRRIILSNVQVGNEVAVVAEYLLSGNVVEKGIVFGGDVNSPKKATMKTGGSSFAVINDSGLDAKGYAILSDGSVIYSK